LKRISASALSDIAKHTPELAQTVVDAGAIAYLAQHVDAADAKLKRQVFSALSQIAKHSVELAEMVVEAEIFPGVLPNLKDSDEYVKKNVATLIREVCKHTQELAQLIVNSGGIAAVVDYVSSTKDSARMPGIMTLGYIASFHERLGMAVIASQGVQALATALREESQDHLQAAIAWALGQIGRHSPEHAQHVAEANVFPALLQLVSSPSEDVRNKATRALNNILQKCNHLAALQSVLANAPLPIAALVLAQFARILPQDPKARRQFVTSNGLKKVQEIKAEPGSQLAETIAAINACFPEEIVKYYSPGYSDALLQRVDAFQPQSA